MRPDGGVRGARKVRQLRMGRPPRHALLPGVSGLLKHKEIVNCSQVGTLAFCVLKATLCAVVLSNLWVSLVQFHQ